jgi:hypothetical protein
MAGAECQRTLAGLQLDDESLGFESRRLTALPIGTLLIRLIGLNRHGGRLTRVRASANWGPNNRQIMLQNSFSTARLISQGLKDC